MADIVVFTKFTSRTAVNGDEGTNHCSVCRSMDQGRRGYRVREINEAHVEEQ